MSTLGTAALFLSLGLASPEDPDFMELVPRTGDLSIDCKKWDGAMPSPCELSLADALFEYRQALDGCAMLHEAEQKKSAQLENLLLTKPVPVEKNDFSLLGMPSWVTPVLAGTLLLSGFMVGALAF